MSAAKKGSGKSIHELIVDKACVKQDVYAEIKKVFSQLNEVLSEVTQELSEFAAASDNRIVVELKKEGDFESQMTLAGDTLVFHMHTNVFTFPPSHMVHRSSYVTKDPRNAYCGVINIYNFLTDSFRFQRMNDSGYLIGRIFVNRERHFFVEGRQQLGYFFNDFSNGILGKDEICLLYTSPSPRDQRGSRMPSSA